MFFGSGVGGGRKSIRSRVDLMRWRSASRASASASARRRRAAGTSIAALRPRSLSATPMFGLSLPTASVNAASSRVEMRCASSRSSRCCDSPISRRRTGRRSAPAAASAAEAAAWASAAAATRAARALARLAHVQLAALQLVAVQLGDRPLGLARRAHLDEAEATRPSGGAVGDHRRRLAGPRLREERLEVRACRVEGKVAHEQLLAHVSLRASWRPLTFFSVAWARSRSPPCDGRDHAQTREAGRVPPMPSRGKPRLAQAPLAGAQPAPAAAAAAERAAVAAAEPLEIEDLRRPRGPSARPAPRARRRFVVGVVHAQASPAQLEGVEAPDRVGGPRRVGELGEREAAWPAGDPVRAQAHAHAGIHIEEHRAQLLLGGLEREVADEGRGRNGGLLRADLSDRSSLPGLVLPLKTSTPGQPPPRGDASAARRRDGIRSRTLRRAPC